MVLGLNGRVRPADLQTLPEDARQAALNAFLEAHAAEMELHLVGDELVAGALPDPDIPTASLPDPGASAHGEPSASTPPADLTADGQSAIDLLLGDYDGVAPTPPAPTPALESIGDPARDGVAPAAFGQGAPNASAPRIASDVLAPTPAPHAKGSFAWILWWIPTLALPPLGGVAAWFFLRRKREFAARAMLTVGLILGLFASVMWLRYAERIAAINEQRNATTYIVVPGK
jgi:hypothetical protein